MAEVTAMRKVFTYLISVMSAVINLTFIGILLLVTLFTKGKAAFETKKRTDPPKILSDPKWGTHHRIYLPHQKINLHYVEKGDRNKPLMVCLHGFPECWFSYHNTLVEFSKDFWVVAVDMRGYGDSDKPTPLKSYQTETLVEDIREFIELLTKEKCILVAHDWGGALAWMVVNKYPNLFSKHVSLNGPHRNAFSDHIFSSISQAKKSWYVLFFNLWYLPEMLFSLNDFGLFNQMFQDDVKYGKKLTDEEVEVYKYYFSQENSLSGPINYYRNFSRDDVQNMRCDKVKSLIIWGAMDSALDIEIAVNTFRYCNDLSVKFVPDAGHFVLQEFPEDVHRHIRTFISN